MSRTEGIEGKYLWWERKGDEQMKIETENTYKECKRRTHELRADTTTNRGN